MAIQKKNIRDKLFFISLVLFIIQLVSVKKVFIELFHNSFFNLSAFLSFELFYIVFVGAIVYIFFNKMNLKERFIINDFAKNNFIIGIVFSLPLLLHWVPNFLMAIHPHFVLILLQGLGLLFLFLGLSSVAFNLLPQKDTVDSRHINIFQKRIVYISLVIIVSKFIFVEQISYSLTPSFLSFMNLYSAKFTAYFTVSTSLSLLIALGLVFVFTHFSSLISRLKYHNNSYWLLLIGILLYVVWFYIKALYFNPRNEDEGIMTIVDYTCVFLEGGFVLLFLVSFIAIFIHLKEKE